MSATNEISPLQLGWFALCLCTKRFDETLAFYERVGFERAGGEPESGWVQLSVGAAELTLMSFLETNLLNLRGGDVPALAVALMERGLEPFHAPGFDPKHTARIKGPRAYDAAAWPPEFSQDDDGKPLPVDGCGDFLLSDPNEHLLYFDTVPGERARFLRGGKFVAKATTGVVPAHKPDLGRLVPELSCSDLGASRRFYELLGLHLLAEAEQRFELGNELDVPFSVTLDAAQEQALVLRFDCDVDAVCALLSKNDVQLEQAPHNGADGRRAAELKDPEGNRLRLRQRR